jgi:phosphoglycerol transferase MdoB-like AlkP superfamily enzyme
MTESAVKEIPQTEATVGPVRAWNPRLSLFFVLLILMLVALFEVMRVGMILRNSSSANGATFGQLLSSFFYGLRFDLAIACYLALPVVVIGHLPAVGLWYSYRLRKIVLWVLTIVLAVTIFVLLAEYEFFREFQTRYNQLAFQYLDQPKIVVGMVWYNYPVVRYVLFCLLLTAACGLTVYGIMRLCFGRGEQKRQPVSVIGEIAQFAVLIGLMIIAMRGGLQSEPLRWGNAYHSNNEFVNQMSLNGLFALGQSGIDHFRHSQSSAWMRRMPADQAKSIARKLIVAPNETLLDPAGSTVLRRTEHPTPGTVSLRKGDRPPNVVLVLMESFSARYVGACGSSPDYTPAFDALAADGVLFDHAFSGGTHTHQGVFCSMLGFPNLPGFEYLMENIVSNQPFLTLPTVLKKQGYQTMFLYNGNLAWDNMEGFFRKQGVDLFVGSPDYVNPIHRDRVWGVTDQDVFDRANKEFEAANATGPFFSLILTLSNHVPFDLPEPLPFARTTDQGEMNKRIDGVRYADWAVGHFIEEAKKLKYYENTLFVFVGDHGFHVPPKLTEAHILFHHVPLLFYSPLLEKKGVKISTAAAQMNILPSILGLLQSTQPQASWGRNLFGTDYSDENFVIFKGSGGSGSDQALVMIRGEKLLVVGSEGSTKLYNYELNPNPAIEPLDDPASKTVLDKMRFELDGYVQSAMTDLTNQHGAGSGGTKGPTTKPGELLHSTDGG